MSEAQTLEKPARRPRQAHARAARQTTDVADLLESYLHDMRGFSRLTFDEEIELAQHVAAGEQWARQQLIEANLPLVIAVARPYSRSGVPLLDLIQEGNLGLIRAAEKFEAGHGCRFGSYATFWIRQAVNRAANKQSRLIQLPEEVARRLGKLQHMVALFWQENGQAPQPDQIAQACQMSLDEVLQLLGLIEQPMSLDMPVDEQSHFSLAEILEDGTTCAPDEMVAREELKQQVRQALASLPARERLIITQRYGLHDGRSRSLLEVGKELGLSGERVRQLEAAALKRIRSRIGL